MGKLPFLIALLAGTAIAAARPTVRHEESLEEARRAYEASDYAKAIEVLEEVSAKEPKNGDIQLLLAKSYLELQQHDAAIRSAEKAVALDPQNSVFHEWLGRAYGDKADRTGWFSAISLAKKTRKEFQMAVDLDERNFSARQALVEFDCSAPGLVGGGEEKARPHIQRLMELDAAEGYYAAGTVVFRGRGRGARGTKRPAGEVLPRSRVGLDQRKARASRTLVRRVSGESSQEERLSFPSVGTRLAGPLVRKQKQNGRSEGRI